MFCLSASVPWCVPLVCLMRSPLPTTCRTGITTTALLVSLIAITPAESGNRSDMRSASGFVVTSDGYVVTSAHVIEGCREVFVGNFGRARIAKVDRINDLALVKINARDLVPAPIRTQAPRLGETVYALGFPLADRLDNALNFTSGLVSALAGLENDRRAIQFTAPIQPGNSGGPLVDETGALIGIVRSKLGDAELLKTKGVTAQNISFAVRAQYVATFLATAGVQPIEVGPGKPKLAVDVAEMGQLYTLQVLCLPEQRTATSPVL